MRNLRPTKGDKREVRREMALTYPPRLEGKVKNVGIKPKKKRKRIRKASERPRKPQSYSARQRKDYHLKSKNR
jgi:hypothetical protein